MCERVEERWREESTDERMGGSFFIHPSEGSLKNFHRSFRVINLWSLLFTEKMTLCFHRPRFTLPVWPSQRRGFRLRQAVAITGRPDPPLGTGIGTKSNFQQSNKQHRSAQQACTMLLVAGCELPNASI